MKSALAMAVVMVLCAAPAFAGDGNVPQGALSSLGLGDMQVLSDAEGMQVRGMSSSASTSSTFTFALSIVDALSPTSFSMTITGSQSAIASETNGGVNDVSNASLTNSLAFPPVQVTVNNSGQIWSIDFSGMISAMGAAMAAGGM